MSMSSTTSRGFSDASSKAARMAQKLASPRHERPQEEQRVDIVDIWVNLVTEQTSAAFLGQAENAHIPGYLGSNAGTARRRRAARADGRARRRDRHLHRRARPPHRHRCSTPATRTPAASSWPAASATRRRPGRVVRRIRELAQHPRFSMVRVMPLSTQVPTNDARHYPVYQVCEELGIPVGINAGIPGPRVRVEGAAPRAARRRADRLPRSRRDRRAHGASLRGAAHELHAQVAEPLRVVHCVRAALHGSEPRRVHEHARRIAAG